MGELKKGQQRNFDLEIMPYISSCSIACGYHSGSPFIIERTIRAAIKLGVKIGAHPSYDDRANFGRISVNVPHPQLQAQLRYQISALKGMVESLGGRLHHVKPHGALYNDMLFDQPLAEMVVKLIKEIDPSLRIYTLAGSSVVEICRRYGISPVREAFADRRYQKANELRSRKLPASVLEETLQILDQVDQLCDGTVMLHGGQIVPVEADSICLHSDTKNAVSISKLIYQYLLRKGIEVAS